MNEIEKLIQENNAIMADINRKNRAWNDNYMKIFNTLKPTEEEKKLLATVEPEKVAGVINKIIEARKSKELESIFDVKEVSGYYSMPDGLINSITKHPVACTNNNIHPEQSQAVAAHNLGLLNQLLKVAHEYEEKHKSNKGDKSRCHHIQYTCFAVPINLKVIYDEKIETLLSFHTEKMARLFIRKNEKLIKICAPILFGREVK